MSKLHCAVRLLAGVILLLCLQAPLGAEEPADARNEYQLAAEAALKAGVHGPNALHFRDQGELALPQGMLFIPPAEAGRWLEAMGNHSDARLLGLIIPEKPETDGDWMVIADYEDSGYVKDDDARDWNADDLLDDLKKGTEAGNADRRARGIPEFEVVGWAEKPRYDASHHRLVWSALARDKGAAADADNTINYNTYALGREGYISLNLITAASHIDQEKPVANALLSALSFVPGKRYEDFDVKSDHVAEYGLAALVAGVAAKKLGLLATLTAFGAKFFKPLLLALGALIAGIKKVFTRRTS